MTFGAFLLLSGTVVGYAWLESKGKKINPFVVFGGFGIVAFKAFMEVVSILGGWFS